MDAVAAADGQRALVFQGAFLQRGQHQLDVGQQQVCRLGQLHGEAGVQHVAAGHAQMDEPAVRPDPFCQPGQEGDDVMAGFPLDGVDPLQVGGAQAGDVQAAIGADVVCCLGRDGAELGHRLGGQRLDVEPDAKSVLRAPDRRHFGAGVAGNHERAPFQSAAIESS